MVCCLMHSRNSFRNVNLKKLKMGMGKMTWPVSLLLQRLFFLHLHGTLAGRNFTASGSGPKISQRFLNKSRRYGVCKNLSLEGLPVPQTWFKTVQGQDTLIKIVFL
jgi:hypothetical protein